MKRRELENLLLTLETTPLVLAAHLRARGRQRISPVTLEDRIKLLADIEDTTWADQAAALAPGMAVPPAAGESKSAFDRFARSRAANLLRLKAAAGVGAPNRRTVPRSLQSLLEAMAAADRTQLAEISRAIAGKESSRESSGCHPVPVLV